MTHQHQITDPEIARQFVMAGKAKITLVSLKTGTRFTFKVRQKIDDDGSISPFFVSVLNGPDNWENYQYIGFMPAVDPTHLVAGKKGKPNAPSFKAFDYFLRAIILRREIPAKLHVWHEGQCGHCGRTLTVPASIATGFGPHCAEKLGIELVDPDVSISAEALIAAAQNDDRPVVDPEFNDSVDDLYAEVEAEAEDDRHSQAMADKFAISF